MVRVPVAVSGGKVVHAVAHLGGDEISLRAKGLAARPVVVGGTLVTPGVEVGRLDRVLEQVVVCPPL